MKRLRLAFLGLFATMAFCFVSAVPVMAVDLFPADTTCKETAAKQSAACQQNGANPFTGPNGTLQKVTNIISYLTGIAAVIMLVIGGLMYVLSNGDSSKISAAKTTVIYALVGLVVIVFARAIILFFINRV
jgi:drug/metabolite transporter (DMT)-like permease